MKKSAVVLLSGGQDSTTCLYWALGRFDKVHALNIVYGQRHVTEVEAAKNIAARAGVPYQQLDLTVLAQIGGSALVGSGDIRGDGGLADSEAPSGLPTSFVPGRNLLFLSVAASYAVKVGATEIVTGVCQTDYSGYPDCRDEFVQAMGKAATLAMPSSCGPITIHTPLMRLTKAQTVALARELPGCWEALAMTVTCYHGQKPGCGNCPACELRAAGFRAAGEVDPA